MTLAVVALLCNQASAQSESGVFLTIRCGKKMPRQIEITTLKSVCLASSPIILASQFESITEVRQINDKVSFDIGLSQKALQMFKQLKANLPDAKFALVVDKEVFSVFPASDLSVSKTFRFEGMSKDHPIFLKIQEKLKAIIDSKVAEKL